MIGFEERIKERKIGAEIGSKTDCDFSLVDWPGEFERLPKEHCLGRVFYYCQCHNEILFSLARTFLSHTCLCHNFTAPETEICQVNCSSK